MAQFRVPFRMVAAAGVLLAGLSGFLAFSPAPSLQAQPDQPENSIEKGWKDGKYLYQDAGQCMGCHALPIANRVDAGAFDVTLLTEYAIWKVHDKHAQAYAVLDGPRGKKIGELLGKGGKPVEVTKAEAGCLSCHAMNNYSEWNKELKGSGIDPRDGVSCGGCHGPSSAWTNAHADPKMWRNSLDSKQKEEKGFRDLRDPVKRAALCMSCHIGNAEEGKVVSHAMMAAGHPPLPPIEISTFAHNEPQHWRNPKDTPAFKDPKCFADSKNLAYQETRFALIGAVVAVRENLKLARDRSNFASGKPATSWPELVLDKDWAKLPGDDELRTEAKARWPELAMAHSDCFACHHDLKFPGYRTTRGFGYHVPGVPDQRVIPGRPLIRSWPMASLRVAADAVGLDIKTVEKPLARLAAETSRRPFGVPSGIGQATEDVIKWCDDLIVRLMKKDFDKDAVEKVLDSLCDLFVTREGAKFPVIPDYETARQIGSFTVVVLEDLGKRQAAASILNGEKGMIAKMNLNPYFNSEKRVGILLDVIRTAGKVPANRIADFNKDATKFADYLKNIGDTKQLQDVTLDGNFRNEFLQTLATGVSNERFTSAIKDPKIITRLQSFSDEEQRHVLEAIAHYDPKWFVEQLEALRKAAK